MSTPLQQRRAGILLHPTSLPSGKLDADVERWLDFLADCGFSIWQVLPLGEPQSGLSPYQCTSAFAMNPALLFDYPAVNANDETYKTFCTEQQFWLHDYALFKQLKIKLDDACWTAWPAPFKSRNPIALDDFSQRYDDELTQLKWQQFQLHTRWQQIREYAAELNILLFGDMPIFVAYDSADVWANTKLFLLDEQGEMEVVTGVPPDYFSETGQRWGNPHYNWETMQADNFSWWRSRIRHHLNEFDLLRIDHFRGLQAVWVIDASCDTAIDGHWQNTPGDALLTALQEELSEQQQLPLVAEDLGIITPEVTALQQKYQLPGMAILQFGFDEFDDNPHKIKNIGEDKIVYTGTHDNDTTLGWYNSLDDFVKPHVCAALQMSERDIDNAEHVVDSMITSAMNSPARMCIIPMQDCLYLDSTARMNTPGTIVNNWLWRFDWQQCKQIKTEKFHELINASARAVAQTADETITGASSS